MTKAGEEAIVGELLQVNNTLKRLEALADRLFPPGVLLTSGQGGGVNLQGRPEAPGTPPTAAPANPQKSTMEIVSR